MNIYRITDYVGVLQVVIAEGAFEALELTGTAYYGSVVHLLGKTINPFDKPEVISCNIADMQKMEGLKDDLDNYECDCEEVDENLWLVALKEVYYIHGTKGVKEWLKRCYKDHFGSELVL